MQDSISNVEFYNKNLNCNLLDVYAKYGNIIKDYFNHFDNTINKKKYDNYYNYVFLRGLQTVGSVFNILLLYLKNLEVSYIHCQQSFLYYIEFIGQIGSDSSGFLQLSSKDAVLFVYKKTIFDINDEYKKKFKTPTNKEKMILSFVEKYICCFNSIIDKLIDTIDINEINIKNNIDEIFLLLNSFPHTLNSIEEQKINIFYTFINKLSSIDITYEHYLLLIKSFFKKLLKKNSLDKNIINKINLYDLTNIMNQNNTVIVNELLI